MTIEIRELVIEARVVADDPRGLPGAVHATARLTAAEEARLIERVTRRVLDALREQRERVRWP